VAAPVSLVLKGSIKNFDEFLALVVPETYIQLIPLPSDGSYSFKTDDQGRFSYASDLPRLEVPKTAAFSFSVPKALPGKYFLAAQRLKAQGLTAGQNPTFMTDKNNKKQTFIVEIPVGASSPLTIAAGDLIVWTH